MKFLWSNKSRILLEYLYHFIGWAIIVIAIVLFIKKLPEKPKEDFFFLLETFLNLLSYIWVALTFMAIVPTYLGGKEKN